MPRRSPAPPVAPDDPRHGTNAGYQAEYAHGGRAATCAACRAAEVAYQRKRSRLKAYGKPMTVNAAGTIRRLQALMAIGHSGEVLAERLGVRRSNLPSQAKALSVRADMAERVKKLYAELVCRDGPSDITRRRAEKAGWATPDQWLGRDMDDPTVSPASDGALTGIDEVAVARALKAIAGRHQYVHLTKQERVEVVRQADEIGLPRLHVQNYLKISWTTWSRLKNLKKEDL